MIFITAKFPVKPEFAQLWMDIVAEFTRDTRAEPGCKWFDWSRSIEDSNEYVLIEAFDDDAAGAHVNSAHFKKAQATLPPHLVRTPSIISFGIEQDAWSELGELAVKE